MCAQTHNSKTKNKTKQILKELKYSVVFSKGYQLVQWDDPRKEGEAEGIQALTHTHTHTAHAPAPPQGAVEGPAQESSWINKDEPEVASHRSFSGCHTHQRSGD